MDTFFEMYFDGKVDFKGDALEIMEYRHDWANFKFTIALYKYFVLNMMPEVLLHTRSQGETYTTSSYHNLLTRSKTKNKFETTTTAVMTSTAGS